MHDITLLTSLVLIKKSFHLFKLGKCTELYAIKKKQKKILTFEIFILIINSQFDSKKFNYYVNNFFIWKIKGFFSN